MRASTVKGPGSRLHSVKCSAPFCKRRTVAGEAVVWQKMPNDAYAEDIFVTHVQCMRVILEDAPDGIPPGNPQARAAMIRRAVEESRSLFPAV